MGSAERQTEMQQESDHLDKLYSNYTLREDAQTKAMREFAFQIIEPYLNNDKNGLELGCSDGYFTEMLSSRLKTLDVVDGSINFIEQARNRNLSNVRYFHALFEEFASAVEYDCVFASYVLEHVLDPRPVLGMVRTVLKRGGLLYVVVPNARALSRQLAMHMGLYADLKELTDNDHRFGHRRVYDRVHLNRDIEAAGFHNVAQGGIMLKILADFQMDKLINMQILQERQLKGLFNLGFEYPDLCGSLFSICSY
jgi:2-polyprenyl-3-methyl-5-hydroxy-6-metoxy-1,4-benzoquinol methylase